MVDIEAYRAVLVGLEDWLPYLAANSGLPGPRGNLELVAACAEEGDLPRALDLVDTGEEFASVCGLVALGRHLGAGDDSLLPLLHAHAADARWRVREGVAMALQRAADDDPDLAFTISESWVTDPDPLVRRAAVAAVCEPRLLREETFAKRALQVVDRVTAGLASTEPADRRTPRWRALRQALGYGWSVAVAAYPVEGMAMFRRLEDSQNPDVQWIVRENRKKARFKRLQGA